MEFIMKKKSQYSTLFIVTTFLLFIVCPEMISGQGLIPNPVRAVVSTELEEPWEIYQDGGFESGDHDIRSISPYRTPPSIPPYVHRTHETVYSGSWAYRIVNSSQDTVEFSVWINPDKAEDVSFSCRVRSDSSECSIRPFMVFEDITLVAGPDYGSTYTIDTTWTLASLMTSTTNGVRFAHAGIEVPPQATLFIDNVSVTVPVWKEPDPTGTVIGGVRVPASPVAPVNICFSIHLEDPQNLITDEAFFWKKTMVFKELAEIFHAHGGYLNIQPELEWALASELYAPSTLADLAADYHVTYSTHTHGPVCKGPDGTPYGSKYCQDHPEYDRNITESDVATYIQIRREKFETLSGISVTDHNGNFDMVHKNLLYPAGVRTLSIFKNKFIQKSYDYLYTNPWRPSDGNSLTDLASFLRHDPNNDLIYIPGFGSNLTKRHERVQLKVRRFAGQFIKYAEKERVNTMNLILHVDAFQSADPDSDSVYIQVQSSGNPVITYSDEFLSHLQYWDDMLTETIDPLVQQGYLQWATHAEICEDFLAWEAEQAQSPDSVLTFIPSAAAGEQGIATLIRLPDQERFSGAAPIAIHVLGGFSGEMLTGQGADLTDQGFIVIFFNFPGSGFPGMKSGGMYDTRGPLSIEALKDVVLFTMDELADKNGKHLSELCGSITPATDNIGLVGWSNGGNATLSVAGSYASELSDLAWIVNWESPVGDGMVTTEAGSHGYASSGNPETNPAYNPDTGEWELEVLKYDPTVDANQHHASMASGELYGGFYFDMNGNGSIDAGVDFIPFPFSVGNAGTIKAYYSERITNWAWNHGLFPVNPPNHLTPPDSCAEFWLVRNGENWFDEIGTYLDHLKFMAVASEEDHAQTALDYPHVLLQYDGLLNRNIALVRLNPDRSYIADILGSTPPGVVDNEANVVFDHISIRTAVQPENIPGLNQKIEVAAGCCELADRTYYGVLDPQLDAVITESTGITVDPGFPKDFSVHCYPNPFNPWIKIQFSIPFSGSISIKMFDLLGRQVDVLKDEFFEAGSHVMKWNAADANISSGIYFIRFNAEDYKKTVKVLYVM